MLWPCSLSVMCTQIRGRALTVTTLSISSSSSPSSRRFPVPLVSQLHLAAKCWRLHPNPGANPVYPGHHSKPMLPCLGAPRVPQWSMSHNGPNPRPQLQYPHRHIKAFTCGRFKAFTPSCPCRPSQLATQRQKGKNTSLTTTSPIKTRKYINNNKTH